MKAGLADKDTMTRIMRKGLNPKTSLNIPFQYRAFESHKAIMDYIADGKYEQDDDHPGICFGFSVEENSTTNYQVKLAFNDHIE